MKIKYCVDEEDLQLIYDTLKCCQKFFDECYNDDCNECVISCDEDCPCYIKERGSCLCIDLNDCIFKIEDGFKED